MRKHAIAKSTAEKVNKAVLQKVEGTQVRQREWTVPWTHRVIVDHKWTSSCTAVATRSALDMNSEIIPSHARASSGTAVKGKVCVPADDIRIVLIRSH